MLLDFRAFPIVLAAGDSADVAAFREALGEHFSVRVAASAVHALQLLEAPDSAVLVVDHSLPDMPAVDLLERARALRPEVVRLLTAEELRPELAEAAINRGCVSGYMRKPWSPDALRSWLAGVLEAAQRDRSSQSLEMSLWHGGQEAAASTIYEEMVHELSNPLGALEINASLVADMLQEVVQEDGCGPEDIRSAAQTALEAHADSLAAIEQMKSLVSRMRHGRRARPRKQGRCDARRVIDATVRVVRAEVEKVAQLEVRVASSPTLLVDASVLGQILLNLLLNAAQAVPADRRSTNAIAVDARVDTEQFLISIRDNGSGIAPGLEDRIFEPFFTTKENGSGLGLSICRELVTRARGTIYVQNADGGGACLEISLPIAK